MLLSQGDAPIDVITMPLLPQGDALIMITATPMHPQGINGTRTPLLFQGDTLIDVTATPLLPRELTMLKADGRDGERRSLVLLFVRF